MTAEAAGALALELSPRGGWKDVLFPEQSAEFDLVLRNRGAAPVPALNLYGSHESPRFTLFGAGGEMIGLYTKAHQYERKVGDLGRKEPPEPKSSPIPAGGAEQISLNVWGYREPLPPGRYSIEAEHRATPGGPFLRTQRYPFQIVPASILTAALGYDSSQRISSVLAWLAADQAPDRKATGAPLLLIRVSAPKGHRSPGQGATSHGEFPKGSLAAVAHRGPGVKTGPAGWVAVTSPGQAVIVRHNMSYPSWRSDAITLPMTNPAPVPGFPDLGAQVLFLATGATPEGPALAGVVVEQQKGPVAQWTTPLKAVPALSACVQRPGAPVSILLAANDARGCRISRLEADPAKGIVTPEKPVRQSESEAIAIAPSNTPERGPAFHVLLAGMEQPNKLTLFAISAGGKADLVFSKDVPGWPMDSRDKPMRAVQPRMEHVSGGSLLLSFTAGGAFYSGHLTPKLHMDKLHDDPKSPPSFPHAAAQSGNETPACFAGDGTLLYFGEGGGH